MRQPQRVTAFFLLFILGGNFFLPVFWSYWQIFPPHDHIILGPVYPGWEHHHGELTQPQGPYHREPIPLLESNRAVFPKTDAAARSKVISLYRSPTGADTILSVEVQLLWLAEWSLLLSKFPTLIWPLDLATLPLSSAFLSPPDKPPVSFQ
jgi:hypothetical protein